MDSIQLRNCSGCSEDLLAGSEKLQRAGGQEHLLGIRLSSMADFSDFCALLSTLACILGGRSAIYCGEVALDPSIPGFEL